MNILATVGYLLLVAYMAWAPYYKVGRFEKNHYSVIVRMVSR